MRRALTEGGSFLVTLSREFVIPTVPAALCVTYEAAFDAGTPDAMRDAFEVALVDDQGRPLTFTIQGAAGAPPASGLLPPPLPASPDACFNHAEGHAPFRAPGAALDGSGSTLAVDVSHLPPGARATLVLRLVNNDRDRATTVRLTDFRLKPADGRLDFGGSPGTALSRLAEVGGGGPGSVADAVVPCAEGGTAAGPAIPRAAFTPTNYFAGGPPGPETADGDSVLPPDGRLVFTTTAEFDRGTLFNTTATNPVDQLELVGIPRAFPFIWIPNENESVSKLDTRTGREVARYWTGPPGFDGQPSRTTVDSLGNCWVANRYAGSVIKFGLLENGQAIDRNGNGRIDTAVDIDGDGDISLTEMLPWGQDECVLFEVIVIPGLEATYVPGTFDRPYTHDWTHPGPRSLAVDGQDNVWIGTLGSRKFYHVEGATGRILRVIDASPWGHSAYGAVTDRNGVIWSSGHDRNHVLRLDPRTDPPTISAVSLGHFVYGLGLDYQGHLFASGWTHNRLTKLNTEPNPPVIVWSRGYGELHQARGVVATQADNDIWVVSSSGNQLHRYDNGGSRKASIGGFSHPTGVAVDAADQIWVADLHSEFIHRINPTNNRVELSKRIVGSGGHYTYSDMTGQVLANIIRRGTWTEIVDSARGQTVWGTLAVSAETPPGTFVSLKVRAADARGALAGQPRQSVVAGQPLPDVRGRFLEVELTLGTDVTNATPVVRDLTVLAVPPPTLVTEAPGGVFAPGAALLLSGRAEAAQPAAGDALAANAVTHVLVNGRAVAALDPAGHFYTPVEIQPGRNEFLVTAADLYGQTATNTLVLWGACPAETAGLEPVTASVTPVYGRTTFNEWTRTLYADLALRHDGTYPVQPPCWSASRGSATPPSACWPRTASRRTASPTTTTPPPRRRAGGPASARSRSTIPAACRSPTGSWCWGG